VLDGGKAWVLRFEQVTHNLNGRRYSYRVPIYLRTGDFRTLYMNRSVNTGNRFMDLVIGSSSIQHGGSTSVLFSNRAASPSSRASSIYGLDGVSRRSAAIGA
jgi:hypothetical protein